MPSSRKIKEQIKLNYGLICLILVVSGIFLGLILATHFIVGTPIDYLTKDPGDLSDLAAYAGFLSYIGIFFWAASATICLFTFYILKKRQSNLEIRRFLLASALFTLILAFDDVFMFHERVLPHFGISDNLMAGVYAALIPIYLFVFFPVIIKTSFILILFSLALFASSIYVDMFFDYSRFSYLFEDGPKFLGIVCWTGYFFSVGESSLTEVD